MTHPTDEELDALVKRLTWAAGIDQAEYPFPMCNEAADAITALRAQLATANARADRAEAALAAQIEADARIVEALYRNALGESDADLESPWKSHKASAFGIAVGAIRAQPHSRAALEPASVTFFDALKVVFQAPGKYLLEIIEAIDAASDGLKTEDEVRAAIMRKIYEFETRVLAALEPAPHVNETPKSEHDRADMLTTPPAPEAKALEDGGEA